MLSSLYLRIFFVGCILILSGGLSLFLPKHVIRWNRKFLAGIRLISKSKLNGPITWRRVLLERVAGLLCLLIGLMILWLIPTEVTCQRVDNITSLPATARNVDSRIQSIVDQGAGQILKGHPVGFSIGVILGTNTATFGYGQTSLTDSRRPDGQTLYEIGSITKVFTALLLADMAEEGLLRLDDPIRKFLPDTVQIPRHGASEIRLQDLVSHLSGLPRIPDNLSEWRDYLNLSFIRNPYANYTTQRLYDYLSHAKLQSSPGTKYGYSNLGMGLLGYILTVNQNTSFDDLVARRICGPLGMNDTRTNLTTDQRSRLARGYDGLYALGGLRIGFPAENWDAAALTGCGGLYSTVDDLLTFISANMGRDEGRLQAIMIKTHEERFKITPDMSVGMGWHILHDRQVGPILGHNGGTGGYSSYAAFNKKHRVGVVMLSNCSSTPGIDRSGLIILKALAELEKKIP